IRGTIGILNYTTLGLSPAMIRLLAEARSPSPLNNDEPVLSYRAAARGNDVRSLYANGLVIALATGAAGALLTVAYAMLFDHIYPGDFNGYGRFGYVMNWAVFWIGIGTILRLMS